MVFQKNTLNQISVILIFKVQKSTLPHEIFKANINGSELKKITTINAPLLSNLEMNDVETFWSDGAEGAKVQSIIVKGSIVIVVTISTHSELQ